MHFGGLIKRFQSIIDIAKKVQSVIGLTIFIVYGNLFGLENYIRWTYEWNLRSGEGNDSRIMFIGPS